LTYGLLETQLQLSLIFGGAPLSVWTAVQREICTFPTEKNEKDCPVEMRYSLAALIRSGRKREPQFEKQFPTENRKENLDINNRQQQYQKQKVMGMNQRCTNCSLQHKILICMLASVSDNVQCVKQISRASTNTFKTTQDKNIPSL
jgi:hypothetical protein